MSKLIKSSRIKIGDERLVIPAAITIQEDAYFEMHHSLRGNDDHDQLDHHDYHDYQDSSGDHPHYSPQEEAEYILEQARIEADLIMSQARDSAHVIEAQALDQARVLYDKSRDEGYEVGVQDGFAAGQENARQLIEEALYIKEEWIALRGRLVQELEQEAVHLILACFEKVLGESVASPEYVGQLIQVGMSKMAYTATVVIRVCERDFTYALALKDKVLAMAENVETLEIKADYALKPGQVYIDTQAGTIDVSLQTQVDEVRQMFEALLHE